VENTIDAIAAARTIFNLPILGEYPQVVLAEAKYNTEREFYLAVVMDYASQRPVLLGSIEGGMDLEAVRAQMQTVVVDQEFSPFYARRLMLKMGLQGALIQSVSAVVEKMYQLFVLKDLDLVEINPLGVSSTGDLMALDGKVTANDAALGRHPNLALFGAKTSLQSPEAAGSWLELKPLERDGNISILCNGEGLGLAIADLLAAAGSKPAHCLILDPEGSSYLSPAERREQLERGLERVVQDKGIKVLLINIVAADGDQARPLGLEIAEVLAANYQRQLRELGVSTATDLRELKRVADREQRPNPRRHQLPERLYPQLVARLVGEPSDRGQEQLVGMPVNWVDDLDEAIAQAVSLAKKSPARD
jgi:succinyl-CoA synthetase beta subunit